MEEYSVVGKRLPDKDAPQKVTGQAQFANDIALSGMLTGKILRSPYPHARILNIDTSRAERLSGVKCVITGKDTSGILYGSIAGAYDEYPLAIGKVRYVGDAVAAVAAIDEDTAEDALELISVEYEELPAVYDPEEAMKDGAPQVHDKTSSPNMHDEKHNIGRYVAREYGDMAKGWAEADHIREDRFVTPAQAHAAMEPHSAIASFDNAGNLTHWVDSQIPFYIRYNLAKVLAIPESKVRVIKPFVGGGFGAKTQMFAKDPCAALLSRLTGRPVRITYTREEVFIATISNYPLIIYMRTGMKKDGTITAQHMKLIYDNGAHNSTAPRMLTFPRRDIVYKTPSWGYEGIVVYTNKTPSGPRRGHTTPERMWAAETQLNMMVADLGLDPIEFRLKNFVYPGFVNVRGMNICSTAVKECLEGVVQQSGWQEKRGKMGPYRGIGIACTDFGGGTTGVASRRGEAAGGGSALNPITATIKLNSDGRVTLFTGAADIGQGSNSTMAQIAAEVLGLSQDDITVISSDTALTPLDHGSFGSRVTKNVGHTVKEAAAEARRQLLEAIAKVTEVGENDLEIRGGQVYIKGRAEPTMAFSQALKMIQRILKLPITATFRYHPDEYFAQLTPATSPAYYVHAAEVEVDPETGKVRVLRITYANDSGTEINPMRVEGQMDGSVQMGVGMTLGEGYVLDKGQMMNASFLHYFFPTAVDMPEVKPVHVDATDPRGPFGAKEAGEGAVCPAAPAITHALYDAIGVWFKELPVTPENVLRALEEKRLGEKKEG